MESEYKSKYKSLTEQNEELKKQLAILSDIIQNNKEQDTTPPPTKSDDNDDEKKEDNNNNNQQQQPPPTLSNDNDDEKKEDIIIWNPDTYGYNKLLNETIDKYIKSHHTLKEKDDIIIELGMKVAKYESINNELRASNKSLRTALSVAKYENIKAIERVQAEYEGQMKALNGNCWPEFVKFIVLNRNSRFPLGVEPQIALGTYYIAKQWEHLKTITVQNDDNWDWEAFHKIRQLRNYWCHDCDNRDGAKSFVTDWSQIVELMSKFHIYQ